MASRYPLHELQRLLRPRQTTRGAVVRVSGQTVQVATAGGLVTATATAGGALKSGQAVTVRDGVAYPAARARAVYAV